MLAYSQFILADNPADMVVKSFPSQIRHIIRTGQVIILWTSTSSATFIFLLVHFTSESSIFIWTDISANNISRRAFHRGYQYINDTNLGEDHVSHCAATIIVTVRQSLIWDLNPQPSWRLSLLLTVVRPLREIVVALCAIDNVLRKFWSRYWEE